MSPIRVLVVRDNGSTTALTPTMINLLIALVILLTAAVLLVGGLFVLRSVRKSRKQREELPVYNEKPTTRVMNHRGLTIATPAGSKRASSIIIQEKQNLIDNSASPPPSPIPEIRITFPEEVDEHGKRQSGRVVVVKVGEHTIGLEPLREELPPYQQSEADRFQSLDLERIGGLKEKELEKQWS
jgi:hypothetical protein